MGNTPNPAAGGTETSAGNIVKSRGKKLVGVGSGGRGLGVGVGDKKLLILNYNDSRGKI